MQPASIVALVEKSSAEDDNEGQELDRMPQRDTRTGLLISFAAKVI